VATILRAVYAYVFLLLVLRPIGRRAVMQSSPFELILIFLFGGTMIQAAVGEDRSLVNASLAVMTIGLMHVLVAFLKQRIVAFRNLVEGTPIVLRGGGTWNDEAMRRAEDISYVIFERSGNICVLKKP
jgi:uncharacterized membrane protein YcaP (DUF421 family)